MPELQAPSRRGFLLGLLAAPAIVRASSLMSIKPLPLPLAHGGLVSGPIPNFFAEVVEQREAWTVEQVRIFQEYMDRLLRGDLESCGLLFEPPFPEGHRVRVMEHGSYS
jgi:hypothetical protein